MRIYFSLVVKEAIPVVPIRS